MALTKEEQAMLENARRVLQREEERRNKNAKRQRGYYRAGQARQQPFEALRAYRETHGYTQAALAEMLGVSAATISVWENGIFQPDRQKLATLEGWSE